MKKTFVIDGGLGRVICSIPALLKYVEQNKDQDITILTPTDFVFFGIEELQDLVQYSEAKGVFKNVFLKSDDINFVEPYHSTRYIRGEISLSQAFDEKINNTTDHTNLAVPKLVTSMMEDAEVESIFKQYCNPNKKTIVIQPFGREAKIYNDKIIDKCSRSFDPDNFCFIVEKLVEHFNVINFSEKELFLNEDKSIRLEANIRLWFSIIKKCDFFVGCDSAGQHIARSFNKKGVVYIPSTNEINVSYPNFFKIVVNEKRKKHYLPFRLNMTDFELNSRMNENIHLMDKQQINNFIKIVKEEIGKS